MRELNNISRIRVSDIPHEGLRTTFDLDPVAVSRRANEPSDALEGGTFGLPRYNFIPPLSVTVELSVESGNVYVKGQVPFSFSTSCVNCLGEAIYKDTLEIELILKKQGKEFEDEDIGFGQYSGEDIEFTDLVEDHLMIKLPYSVNCSPSCKGLCPKCGKNLNIELCNCVSEEVGNTLNPFAKLKDLKLQ